MFSLNEHLGSKEASSHLGTLVTTTSATAPAQLGATASSTLLDQLAATASLLRPEQHVEYHDVFRQRDTATATGSIFRFAPCHHKSLPLQWGCILCI